MPGPHHEPRLYSELSEWWPIFSAPDDYAEPAVLYHRAIVEAAGAPPPKTLLELGSGAGNNASHLKGFFEMTLVDLSPGMLVVSRRLNPECPHLQGDMRSVRLGRLFDAVFIQDAIMYMTTETDLRRAMETAFVHLRPGGVALFAPDHVRETFRPGTSHGGQDGAGRAIRYLEWTWDPDPTDTTYVVDFAHLLRDPDGSACAEHERHILGLFPRATWLRLMGEVGFEARTIPFEHSELPPGPFDLFLGVKR